jgi:hypothetical protein
VLDGEVAAGAAEPGHHLVGDEEDTVAVADLPDAGQVARGSGDGPERGADDRLGDEGGDVLGADLRMCGRARRRSGGYIRAGPVGPAAVGMAGRDVLGGGQGGRVGSAAPSVASVGQGPRSSTVVRHPAADDEVACPLTPVAVVLDGHLGRIYTLNPSWSWSGPGRTWRGPWRPIESGPIAYSSTGDMAPTVSPTTPDDGYR